MSDHVELTVCPECGAAAEVIERFVLQSTNGPVAHAKVRCVTGPWFVLADRSAWHQAACVRWSA